MQQNWCGKDAVCRLLRKHLLVDARSVPLRLRFDPNLKHNLVFFLLGRGLPSMLLENIIDLDATTKAR